MKSQRIICAGEILWDSLPAGLFLGGAPFNVAHDLHSLGKNVEIISRVGKDALGNEVLRRLRIKGIPTDKIQIDDLLPTGIVEVGVDRTGGPEYRIKEPAAWDAIRMGEDLLGAVRDAAMVVYGTLACRKEVSRGTMLRLISAASSRAFDLNLRPGTDDKELVRELLEAADIVKMNSAELDAMRNWFGLPEGAREAADKIAKEFSCKLIAISLGPHGGSIWHEGRWVHHPGFRVHVQTTVGAGDAFLAGIITALLDGRPDEGIIEEANLLGAYVATRNEGAPEIELERLESIRENLNPL